MNEVKNISVLIFDLDGTLADTVGSIRDAVDLVMDDMGYPRHTLDGVRQAIGHGARRLMERTLPPQERTVENVERAFSLFRKYYGETYLNCRECFPGIKEALTELKAQGYRLAVLSNKPDERTVGLCNSLFGTGFFEYLRGQTSAPAKPDPTVPRMIAAFFGVGTDKCAMIGDSDVDIMTGKNSGMFTVAVSWGYKPKNLLESLSPDRIADDAEELFEIFSRARASLT